jgi:hypothetical protein
MDAINTSKYAPTTWGATEELYDFTCPSGQVCQVKRVGLSDLLQAGLLDEMDTLGDLMQTNVVQPAKGKGPQDRQPKKPTKAQAAAAEEQAVADLMKNPKQFAAMSRLLERVVAVMVVQPKVVSPWDGDKKIVDRVEGVIYTDSIRFEDQMALFGEAMGDKQMDAIASFRDGAVEGVESVEDGANVSLSSK